MRCLLITGTCYFLRNCYISRGLCSGWLKMFGEEKPWENVQCTLVLKLYPDFLVLLFHFHQFYFNVTNTFGKTYLTSKLLVSEKVTSSGRLKLVSRWAGVNALAQIKFRFTIHLLSQCLLA